MKVRLTTDRAGHGYAQEAGEVIDLPHAEARALVKSGQAEPAKEQALTPDHQPRGRDR